MRDSFIFYRSFLEAIKCMPPEVQAEVYPAIIEYALNGKEPKGMSDIAKGVFILVKPVIDGNNSRYENGKKGAQYGKLGGRPAKKKVENQTPQPTLTTTPSQYNLTFEQELEQMRSDQTWRDSVYLKFHISAKEFENRLAAFATHHKCEYEGKAHNNLADAKRHFNSWMRKAYPTSNAKEESAQPSYDYKGGFGGQDV